MDRWSNTSSSADDRIREWTSEGLPDAEIGVRLGLSVWEIRERKARLRARGLLDEQPPGRGRTRRRLWPGLRLPGRRAMWGVAGLLGLGAIGLVLAASLTQPAHKRADSLRVLVAYPLDPAPGIRVAELPEGEERDYLEDFGTVWAVSWSPTGDALWALGDPEESDFPNGGGRTAFALMSYPEGDYRLFELPIAKLSLPIWSPDGTRVAFSGDGFRLYTSEGDLLASYTAEDLGIAGAQGGTDPPWLWSEDSGSVLTGPSLPAWVVDREGRLRVRLTNERLGLDDGVEVWLFRWSESARELLGTSVTSDPGGGRDSFEMAWLRIELRSGDPTVTVLPDQPEETFWVLQSLRPPPKLLEELEAHVPPGWQLRGLETPVGPWGWMASFAPKDGSGRRQPTDYLTLIQVGDIVYQYSDSGLSPPLLPGAPLNVLVLGAPDPPPLLPPDSDTTGCPVDEMTCRAARFQLELLLEGRIADAVRASSPERFFCGQINTRPGATETCDGSTTGVSRFAFPLDERTGATAFVPIPEFEIFLEAISSRLAGADAESKDEFGGGAPRVVGFTQGPASDDVFERNGGFPTYVNITWIEDSPGGPERVVLGLKLRAFGIAGAVLRTNMTGWRLALTGGEERNAAGELTRSLLWSPPGD